MKKCILCDDKLPAPPAGMSYQHHAYLLGLAHGVVMVLKKRTPFDLCAEHAQNFSDACAVHGLQPHRRDGEPVGGGS